MAKRRAFTLVELLVVIAIVSMLAGLLLPVLEDAIESARTVQCLNNKKQVMLATLQYAEDNNGWTFVTDSYSLYGMAHWTTMQAKLINEHYLPGESAVIRGWCCYSTYANVCPVLHCPTATYNVFTSYQPVPFGFRGYYYTFFNLHGPRIMALNAADYLAGNAATPEPLPPSRFALWVDAVSFNAWDAGASSYGKAANYFHPSAGYGFHFRHLDGATGTAACADGHVASLGEGDMADYGITQWRVRLDPP